MANLTDLTKLTTEELTKRCGCIQLAEIRRRLERLEKCEAAIAKCKHAGECGYEAARAAMEGE